MKYILIILVLAGCSRKVHSFRSDTTTDQRQVHVIDSLKEVTRTLTQAYEDLFNSTGSSEVTFRTDTGRIGGAGMPHVIIRPDGTKEFTGVYTFKDNTSVTKRLSALRQEIIDSMSRTVKRDTVTLTTHEVIKGRDVKSRFIPVWMWIVLVIAGLLWINERFGIARIPFLTKNPAGNSRA